MHGTFVDRLIACNFTSNSTQIGKVALPKYKLLLLFLIFHPQTEDILSILLRWGHGKNNYCNIWYLVLMLILLFFVFLKEKCVMTKWNNIVMNMDFRRYWEKNPVFKYAYSYFYFWNCKKILFSWVSKYSGA